MKATALAGSAAAAAAPAGHSASAAASSSSSSSSSVTQNIGLRPASLIGWSRSDQTCACGRGRAVGVLPPQTRGRAAEVEPHLSRRLRGQRESLEFAIGLPRLVALDPVANDLSSRTASVRHTPARTSGGRSAATHREGLRLTEPPLRTGAVTIAEQCSWARAWIFTPSGSRAPTVVASGPAAAQRAALTPDGARQRRTRVHEPGSAGSAARISARRAVRSSARAVASSACRRTSSSCAGEG
jgi:hypothetical protein